jgi:hypothetical protein
MHRTDPECRRIQRPHAQDRSGVQDSAETASTGKRDHSWYLALLLRLLQKSFSCVRFLLFPYGLPHILILSRIVFLEGSHKPFCLPSLSGGSWFLFSAKRTGLLGFSTASPRECNSEARIFHLLHSHLLTFVIAFSLPCKLYNQKRKCNFSVVCFPLWIPHKAPKDIATW